MENKADGESSDGNAVFRVTGSFQTVHESAEHFSVGKADAGLHGKTGGLGKASYEKGGEPPVTLRIANAFVSGIAQKEGAVQHFIIFRAGKPCGFIIRFGDNAVCVVYADFRAGIDAVLPFPEFDQPCASPIIEIDGKGVEYHLETWRHIVIEPCVSGVPLRGVHRGGKETMVAVKTITERINKLV